MEQNTPTTALLVMDMQVGILSMFSAAETLLPKVAKAITHAREKKIPVIYVVVGFRQGAPEVSMNNKSFAAGREKYAKMNMAEFMTIHSDLAPQTDDIIITKRRVSAFTGSDLEVVLRAFGIKRIALTGIATGGVVLSTTREAADRDYAITIIADCCADLDEEVHRVLTTKIFPRQADVVTLEDWTKI
jgi:nicotinamidase-related amidase